MDRGHRPDHAIVRNRNGRAIPRRWDPGRVSKKLRRLEECMSASVIGLIVFMCVFGGALVGVYLRRVLPEHHRSAESRDLVRVATALLATMTALVLGLLIGSA